ncbi:Dihydroorotate dehydrogenase electron transfer subunit [Planctomycetales bacterium 10988]|nr:Dihydroorotate dehydrogenase electron transfer subunit [Planctomycetales bacterium 10988]
MEDASCSPAGIPKKSLCQQTVRVIENVKLATETYRLRVECPTIAKAIVPGQFVMVRLLSGEDPLLGRPFALYDVAENEQGEQVYLDIVYLVLGRMTRLLTQVKKSQEVEIWGPLGNGFSPATEEHLIFVAGGIGQTPFLAYGRESLQCKIYGDGTRQLSPDSQRKVTFCYGARSGEYLAGLDDFSQAGMEVRCSTDDGSYGHHGFVTDLLLEELQKNGGKQCQVACCGPEPMMEAVAAICARHQVPCEVSLETPMACGLGICFSCVAKIRTEGEDWDYARTCMEGPVFDAQRVLF